MKKIISLLLFISLLISSVISCTFPSATPEDDGTKINIGVMSGPTGMGMAKLIDDYKNNEKYEFIAYTDPETEKTVYDYSDTVICSYTSLN